uniref:Transposase n=1 Tax=Steinernema glaseri TaxID=37863 RepID=A0A1I7YTX1_9BILA
MERISLDFVERVVNLLSYDGFQMVYNGYYRVCKDEKDNRNASAFSRLSRPWPKAAASLKECCVYISDDDVYSIHEVEKSNMHQGYKCLSEVDIQSWDPRKHVVREISISRRRLCACYPTCERRLSADVLRRLQKILGQNQRPVNITYRSFLSPEETKVGENLDQLLPAIHGIGLLEVSSGFGSHMSRLLEKPVNFLDPRISSVSAIRRETLVIQIVEAMKKGLLRGWNLGGYLSHYSYQKMIGAILDVHEERPPKCFCSGRTEPFSSEFTKRLLEIEERWKALPGNHEIRWTDSGFRYVH